MPMIEQPSFLQRLGKVWFIWNCFEQMLVSFLGRQHNPLHTQWSSCWDWLESCRNIDLKGSQSYRELFFPFGATVQDGGIKEGSDWTSPLNMGFKKITWPYWKSDPWSDLSAANPLDLVLFLPFPIGSVLLLGLHCCSVSTSQGFSQPKVLRFLLSWSLYLAFHRINYQLRFDNCNWSTQEYIVIQNVNIRICYRMWNG